MKWFSVYIKTSCLSLHLVFRSTPRHSLYFALCSLFLHTVFVCIQLNQNSFKNIFGLLNKYFKHGSRTSIKNTELISLTIGIFPYICCCCCCFRYYYYKSAPTEYWKICGMDKCKNEISFKRIRMRCDRLKSIYQIRAHFCYWFNQWKLNKIMDKCYYRQHNGAQVKCLVTVHMLYCVHTQTHQT